jgi:hypothetical protein
VQLPVLLRSLLALRLCSGRRRLREFILFKLVLRDPP